MSVTHQHSQQVSGPAAGSKFYGGELTENGRIRHDVVKVSYKFDTFVLRINLTCVTDIYTDGHGFTHCHCTAGNTQDS